VGNGERTKGKTKSDKIVSKRKKSRTPQYENNLNMFFLTLPTNCIVNKRELLSDSKTLEAGNNLNKLIYAKVI
jgi:hypothetical protein